MSTTDLLNSTVQYNETELPVSLQFNGDSLLSVLAYSTLFVIGAIGNLMVFTILCRQRHRKSRVNAIILHLNVADLIVTFVMMPIEIFWHATVSWRAGDIGCRFFMFMRPFGLYLSSYVLITISLDRYFVIASPLSVHDARRRCRIMLALAWLLSVVSSLPQAYNLFNFVAVYAAPLVVIVITYSLILFKLYRRSKPSVKETQTNMNDFGRNKMEKARSRTFKMTIVIVLVFMVCYTPYYVMAAWWWIDKESARNVDSKVQRALMLFAVSNSCANPVIYGMFSQAFMKEAGECCKRSNKPPYTSYGYNQAAVRAAIPLQVLHGNGGVGERLTSENHIVQSPKSNSLSRPPTPPHISGGRSSKSDGSFIFAF